MNNTLNVTGEVNLKLYDEYNQLKEERTVKNLVVNNGLDYIAKRMVELNRPNEMKYMALGTSDTLASDATRNLLVAELADTRLETNAPTVTGGKVSYVRTYDPGVGTSTGIKEAGIFNTTGITAGMLCRTTFSPIPKGSNDTLTISWSITISTPV